MKKISFENVKKIIMMSLEELGVYVDETEKDIDMNNYGMDSFLYIAFIVSLEEKLQISFPDQLLVFDNFSSINGFTNLVKALIDEQSC